MCFLGLFKRYDLSNVLFAENGRTRNVSGNDARSLLFNRIFGRSWRRAVQVMTSENGMRSLYCDWVYILYIHFFVVSLLYCMHFTVVVYIYYIYKIVCCFRCKIIQTQKCPQQKLFFIFIFRYRVEESKCRWIFL